MSDVLYAINLKSVVTKSIIGIVLGVIMLVVPISSIAQLIIAIIGMMMIITNSYKLYQDYKIKENSDNEMLFDGLNSIIGFILLFFPSTIITLLVAIYLIIVPIYELYKVKFSKNLVINKLPILALGIILLVSGINTLDPIFKILGIIIIIASLGYFALNYYLYKKSGVKIIK